MNAVLPITLAGRFGWLFEGLCKAIGADAYRRGMEAALAWAIWNRVRLLGERFMMVAARARDGRFAAARAVKGAIHPDRKAPPRAPSGPGTGLPREFGWVRRVLPETAQFAGVLAYLLRDPETAALVETTPQAGRILRPLCRLLGVQAPEFLRRRKGAPPPEGLARDPPPHPAVPAPRAEGDDDSGGDAGAAEGVVADATTVAVETPPPKPVPPPVPHHLRPGGLYWDWEAKRWAWS